jgi:hypothetical protein
MHLSSFSAEFHTEKSKFWSHIPGFLRNIRQTLEGQKQFSTISHHISTWILVWGAFSKANFHFLDWV